MTLFYIALFGVLGVLARYGLGLFVDNLFPFTFPVGTFGINLVGSFLIGLVYVIGMEKNLIPESFRLGITVGFLGGFTTFSAYVLEGVRLIQETNYFMASFYLVLSPLLGLLAAFMGFYFAKILF